MAKENSHVLFAYGFDGKGGGFPLNKDDLSESIKSKTLTWAHFDADHPETRKWLEHEISYLDPYIVGALLAEETRPRIVQIGDGALIILRGVNLTENAAPEDMVSVRLWIDKYRIISLRKRPIIASQDIEEKLITGKGPKNSGAFIAMLISRLFERMEPVFATLDEETDKVEQKAMGKANPALRDRIVNVRKQALIFRRYITPQRDVVAHLRNCDLSWLSSNDERNLQESLDRITRYVEHLDAVRERSQIVKDELSYMMAERLNKNMYRISIMTAIFLPLTFLTGLFGINVGGIPGSESPGAFLEFSLLMTILIIVEIILFKKMKWF